MPNRDRKDEDNDVFVSGGGIAFINEDF